MKLTYIKINYAYVHVQIVDIKLTKIKEIAKCSSFNVQPFSAIETCFNSFKEKKISIPRNTIISTYEVVSFISNKPKEEFLNTKFEDLKWDLLILDDLTSTPPINFINKVEEECRKNKLDFVFPERFIPINNPKYLFQKNLVDSSQNLVTIMDSQTGKNWDNFCNNYGLRLRKITPLNIASFGIPITQLNKIAIIETHCGSFVLTIFNSGKILTREYFPIENNNDLSEEIINYCLEKGCESIVPIFNDDSFNLAMIENRIFEMGGRIAKINQKFNNYPYICAVTNDKDKRNKKLNHICPSFNTSTINLRDIIIFIKKPILYWICFFLILTHLIFSLRTFFSLGKEYFDVDKKYSNIPKALRTINRIESIRANHSKEISLLNEQLNKQKAKNDIIKSLNNKQALKVLKEILYGFNLKVIPVNFYFDKEKINVEVMSKATDIVQQYQKRLQEKFKSHYTFLAPNRSNNKTYILEANAISSKDKNKKGKK